MEERQDATAIQEKNEEQSLKNVSVDNPEQPGYSVVREDTRGHDDSSSRLKHNLDGNEYDECSTETPREDEKKSEKQEEATPEVKDELGTTEHSLDFHDLHVATDELSSSKRSQTSSRRSSAYNDSFVQTFNESVNMTVLQSLALSSSSLHRDKTKTSKKKRKEKKKKKGKKISSAAEHENTKPKKKKSKKKKSKKSDRKKRRKKKKEDLNKFNQQLQKRLSFMVKEGGDSAEEAKPYLALLKQLEEAAELERQEEEENPEPTPMSFKELRAAVVEDAAKMGRLIKQTEHTVEALVDDDDLSRGSSSDESWTLKRPSSTKIDRSPFFRVMNEAAVLAQMKFKPEIYEETESESSDSSEESEDDIPQWRKRAVKVYTARRRASGIVEGHMKVHITTKMEQQKLTPAQILELEDQEKINELPTAQVPVFKKKQFFLTRKQLRGCVPKEAAEASRQRHNRLKKYHQLNVQKSCPCKYCKCPSVSQTETYQRLRIRQFILKNNTDANAYLGSTALVETETRNLGQKATKIQAFVRGCLCRGAVSEMLAGMIEALLAQAPDSEDEPGRIMIKK